MTALRPLDFSDSPAQRALRARAAALARELMAYEDACETPGGLAPAVQAELAARARPAWAP